MLYMTIEHFRGGDAAAVYRRFRERGRLAPEGLRYISSWVDEKLERCFQLMEPTIGGCSMGGSRIGKISWSSRYTL